MKKSKKHCAWKKDYIWNLTTCSCENGKYLASIIDNSVIMCDEIIRAVAKSYNEKTKSVPTNFNEKKVTFYSSFY